MTTADRDGALVRFRMALVEQLDPVQRSDKAVKLALRLLRQTFGADVAWVGVVGPGGDLEARYVMPRGETVPEDLLDQLGRPRRPKLPEAVMTAPLERRERVWGHVVLVRREGAFDRAERRDLGRAVAFVSRQLQRSDRERAAQVRTRIDRKILEQLRPNDLFYQLLHGLRSLTRYDHSAAVLVFDPSDQALRLAAEQIAWRKGKSRRVGGRLVLDDEVLGVLETGRVHGFDRPEEGGPWVARRPGRGARVLADSLNGARLGDDESPPRSLLLAPLVARDRLLGVVEIAGVHPGTLGAWEAELVRGFLPQAAVAVHNLDRAESLEQGMLQAERKHVMAELARGVSHDVNNALGAILPLVQQMAADLEGGRADVATLRADLDQVQASVQVCRRIFGGMLAFGQGSVTHPAEADVGHAVRSAMGVLEESLRRHGIDLQLSVPDLLPRVRGTRGDLEQVVLNLAGNARDAMSAGGSLRVSVVSGGREVILTVADTGPGIAAEALPRVAEPFFTTKRHGNGLGLSICRSIVWTMGGAMDIRSAPDQGTTVTVRLPVIEDEG